MAGRIPESTIEEIIARTDIAELVESYGVQVRRSGSSVKACCPFHHEKTPSFNLTPSKGMFHCFGCGESGSSITFVMKMEGLTFVEAAKKLAGRCGVKIETREDPNAGRSKRLLALMNELSQFYWRCLEQAKSAAPAREYLKGRELGEEVWKDWTIGYAPIGAAPILKWAEKYGYTASELEAAGVIKISDRPGDKGYHRFSGRLMFSVRDRQGRVVAFSGRQLVEKKNSGKYVNSPETIIFKKSNVLFGFDRASGAIVRSPHREVICCEGQIDTIRLHLAGFTNAVASQGTAFTDEHARMIKRVADAAVLMYDDDAAGHKATVKVAGMLLAMEMPVRVVSLPSGDDPDSYLRAHSARDLQRLIDDAESIVAFQCRAERAKEKNPDSIDAVARVARAVTATIAMCPSAVLRARMADEAAHILALPPSAVAEEIDKAKDKLRIESGRRRAEIAAEATSENSPAADRASPPDDDGDGAPPDAPDSRFEAEPPPQFIPPPPHELALMELMVANEYDAALSALAKEFLPDALFCNDLTRRFVGAWHNQVEQGEDTLSAFAANLPRDERKCLDRVLANGLLSCASGLSQKELMQSAIRALWCDAIKRERGMLPASGDSATEKRRMKMTLDMKRISTEQVAWDDVTKLLRGYMSGGAV